MSRVTTTRCWKAATLAIAGSLLALMQARAETQESAGPNEPPRVTAARASRGEETRALFEAAGVSYPPGEILLRGLKREGELELWAGRRGAPMILVHTFPICAASGGPGPKRRQGDLQVPEGFYRVTQFNPSSSFHLSFRINYPNASDRLRAHGSRPGGDIFIHGRCASIGCLAMGDEAIEMLYLAALDTHQAGGTIDVHLFPMRMDASDLFADVDHQTHHVFWREELFPGWEAFERTRRPPRVRIDGNGRYRVEPSAPPGRAIY